MEECPQFASLTGLSTIVSTDGSQSRKPKIPKKNVISFIAGGLSYPFSRIYKCCTGISDKNQIPDTMNSSIVVNTDSPPNIVLLFLESLRKNYHNNRDNPETMQDIMDSFFRLQREMKLNTSSHAPFN